MVAVEGSRTVEKVWHCRCPGWERELSEEAKRAQASLRVEFR